MVPKRVVGSFDPLTAEFIPMREILLFSCDRGIPIDVLDCNFSNVVGAFNSKKIFSSGGLIVDDIISLLREVVILVALLLEIVTK